MAREGALLFGRRTYEKFAEVWGGRTDNPFTPVLERRQKYVASTALSEPLPWINPLLLLSGRRLFPDGVQARLQLVDSVTTTTGEIIATYRPVRTGADSAHA